MTRKGRFGGRGRGVTLPEGAAPGEWDHGASQTVTGTGFGTKSTAAPVLHDIDQAGTPTSSWSLTVPNDAQAQAGYTSAYNLQYRTVGYRSVGGPHSRATHYLVGGHTDTWAPYSGGNVMATVLKSSRSNNDIYYHRWYARLDPNWEYSSVEEDSNHKIWAFGYGGAGPYETPHDGYVDYNQGAFNNGVDDITHKLGVDILDNPDNNGNDNWWNAADNPGSQWVLYEVEFKVHTSSGDTGYIKMWNNGALTVDYEGSTDDGFSTSMNLAIGGYSSTYVDSPTNNFRYFCDNYLDWTPARVILGNATTLASSTIREIQIPTSWSSTSIGITVNLGAFSNGATAYVHVVPSTGIADVQNNVMGAITLGS